MKARKVDSQQIRDFTAKHLETILITGKHGVDIQQNRPIRPLQQGTTTGLVLLAYF